MMIFSQKLQIRLKSIFKYRSINVTLLTFVTAFMVVLRMIFLQKEDLSLLDNASDEIKNLVDYSWAQLQIITEKPHPYSSHNNINVHDHIVSEIERIVNSSNRKETIIVDTEPQNLLFKQIDVFDPSSKDTRVISYESNNILVKLKGSDSSLPGLMIANHFDSVPIGTGKNDANTGTVTLLAILEHLKDKPITRDIIFNFNNNEEFGLLGATSFMKHSWLKGVKFFLNLEGVSGGGDVGKPILFRTSNVQTANLYKEAVPSNLAFGNSIFQYGFLSRWLSSETDFKVYEDSLIGWDISFFKNRRFYHTMFDSTKYDTKYGVFSMLDICLNLVNYMGTSKAVVDEEKVNKAIYFDFAGKFHVFDSKKFNELNIVLLILFPLLIAVSWNINGLCLSTLHWAKPAFSIFVSGYCINLSVNFFLNRINPMFVSKSFYLPLLALLAEFILVNVFLSRVILKGCYRFKSIATLEITAALWLLLVSKTIKNMNNGYQSTYIYALTIIYTAFGISSIIGVLFDPIYKQSRTEIEPLVDQEREVLVSVSNDYHDYNAIENLQESNESTGSIGGDDFASEREEEAYMQKLKNPIFGNWWLQYLLTVPFLTLFITYSCTLVLQALHQSVTESFKSLRQVSLILSYSAFFMALPLIPFAPKLNHYCILLLTGIFLISSYISLKADPFTTQTPIKIRVAEFWDLNSKKPRNYMSASSIDLSKFYGNNKHLLLSNYLEDLPSQKPENTVACVTSSIGSQVCEWDIPAQNLTGRANSIFDIEVLNNTRLDDERTVYEPIRAALKIKNIENRVCTLFFPKENSVKQIKTSNGLSWVKPLEYGVDELQLHKLDFKEEFEVELTWIPKLLLDTEKYNDIDNDKLEVDIKCYFGDLTLNDVYQSDGIKELLDYGNSNFVISNMEKGVIVSKKTIIL